MRLFVSAVAASIVLLGLTGDASAQTQEEIDMVTRKMGRPQTKSSTCSFIAGMHEGLGQYPQAIEYYNKMLKIYAADPALGTDCPKYGWVLTKIAICEKLQGPSHLAAAMNLCMKALGIAQRRDPQKDRYDADYLRDIQENCSMVFGKQIPLPKPLATPTVRLEGIPKTEISNLAKREAETIRLVELYRPLGATDMRYVKELLYLANIYTLEEKYSLAEPAFKQVIKSAETRFGKNDRMMLTPLSNYGFMLKSQGRTAEANVVLERMKKIFEASKFDKLKKGPLIGI